MDGYLLDTNVIVTLLRPNHRDGPSVRRRLAQVPSDSPVYISAAALCELQVGPILGKKNADEARREIDSTITQEGFMIRDVTKKTAVVYGDLKARLMLKYNRRTQKNIAKWPERWTLPDTGALLGIDEFDLLMVAHAIEFRLVLVTNDEMPRIREGLGDVAGELHLEDWTEESQELGE